MNKTNYYFGLFISWAFFITAATLVILTMMQFNPMRQCWLVGNDMPTKVERFQCKVQVNGQWVPYDKWRAV